MARVTYKIVPITQFAVYRESEENAALTVMGVALCHDKSTALATARALTLGERASTDDDTIEDPVIEEAH